jgi:hypothetical protein
MSDIPLSTILGKNGNGGDAVPLGSYVLANNSVWGDIHSDANATYVKTGIIVDPTTFTGGTIPDEMLREGALWPGKLLSTIPLGLSGAWLVDYSFTATYAYLIIGTADKSPPFLVSSPNDSTLVRVDLATGAFTILNPAMSYKPNTVTARGSNVVVTAINSSGTGSTYFKSSTDNGTSWSTQSTSDINYATVVAGTNNFIIGTYSNTYPSGDAKMIVANKDASIKVGTYGSTTLTSMVLDNAAFGIVSGTGTYCVFSIPGTNTFIARPFTHTVGTNANCLRSTSTSGVTFSSFDMTSLNSISSAFYPTNANAPFTRFFNFAGKLAVANSFITSDAERGIWTTTDGTTWTREISRLISPQNYGGGYLLSNDSSLTNYITKISSNKFVVSTGNNGNIIDTVDGSGFIISESPPINPMYRVSAIGVQMTAATTPTSGTGIVQMGNVVGGSLMSKVMALTCYSSTLYLYVQDLAAKATPTGTSLSLNGSTYYTRII